jgi:Ca2+-binding RTX toxin-like protein
VLKGGLGDDSLAGGGGDDRLEGGAGNDLLDGGSGVDAMLGGTGDDIYIVGEAGDMVTELADQGTDTVKSAIDYTLGDNVENLILTGTALHGTGNALNNVITGNAGDNVLSGGEGNDLLSGGSGLDRLFGGSGNDRLIGGDGRDFLTGGEGVDTFVAELNSTKVSGKNLNVSTDTILDFASGTDKIDLSALGLKKGQIVGFGNNKNVGDISFRVFSNVAGAEAALGFDIDGQAGTSTHLGPVTVVFVNQNGGAIDVALALIGTRNGVSYNDFVFNEVDPPLALIGTSRLSYDQFDPTGFQP